MNMAASVCSRRIRSAAGLEGFADAGAVGNPSTYRVPSGTDVGWNCWGGASSSSQGGSSSASSGACSDEEGTEPPRVQPAPPFSRASSHNLASTTSKLANFRSTADYSATVGHHHASPPRFELPMDGENHCRAPSALMGLRWESPFACLPSAGSAGDVSLLRFNSVGMSGSGAPPSTANVARVLATTGGHGFSASSDVYSVPMTDAVSEKYLSPDIPLIYVSCISTVVLVYFILFFDCRAMARMVFPVSVDELHYHSMAKLETGLNVTASILLAFFVWLLHALLFDVAGMLTGVVPSAITFSAVFSYRVMSGSPGYLVAALVAVACGFAAARSLEAQLRRRGSKHSMNSHISR